MKQLVRARRYLTRAQSHGTRVRGVDVQKQPFAVFPSQKLHTKCLVPRDFDIRIHSFSPLHKQSPIHGLRLVTQDPGNKKIPITFQEREEESKKLKYIQQEEEEVVKGKEGCLDFIFVNALTMEISKA